MHVISVYDDNLINHIVGWYDLAIVLGIKTNLLSYTLRDRDKLQTKIRLGDRTVYKSAPVLKFVQMRLQKLFEYKFSTIKNTDHILSYRKGVSIPDAINKVPHAKMLISFDIRHYYDSITLDHITNALTKLGMTYAGARLVGRYCLVKNSLQQGSPASPVLSNIVGYFELDKIIFDILSAYKVKTTYIRYCDNIAIFVHSEYSPDYPETIKKIIKRVINFKTHKWACIADNNPVMHQKFLGIVLNAEARAELEIVNRLRSILFNCCLTGIYRQALNYLETCGVKIQNYDAKSLINDSFVKYLRGHINYIKQINTKQGLILEKLYAAAQYLHDGAEDRSYIIDEVKKYRHNESIEEYMTRIKSAYMYAGCVKFNETHR